MSESNSGASAPAAESAAPVDSSTGSEVSQAESGQEVSEIQDAVDAGEISQAQAQKMMKKYKLKIQGKEQEIDVDLSDDNFIRDQLQLAEMSKRSMQQSAELKKAYLKEMERLKSDPFSVLQELGLDPEELSAGFISKKIEEMKKSPEQLASEKMAKELEEARAEAKKLKEERELEQMSKLQQEAAAQLNDEIDRAISGHKKLPNSPLVRKKIADSMLWAMNNGYGDVTAEDVVPMVEKELRAELNGLYEGLDDESFEDWAGRERIARIKKAKRVAPKVPGLSDVKPTTASLKPTTETKQSSQKVRAKDLFRNMGK